MTSRPILFSAPMVRALLSGAKTQTRRAIKLPHENPLGEWEPTTFGTDDQQAAIWHTRTGDCIGCPYGVPGDRLWVRESFADLKGTGIEHYDNYSRKQLRYAYAADCLPGSHSDEARKDYGVKWKPSIHMPRDACRIELEIKRVDVQRLQDISDLDAIAEGCYGGDSSIPGYRYNALPAEHFMHLWNSINGPDAWKANPWVWAIYFERIAL